MLAMRTVWIVTRLLVLLLPLACKSSGGLPPAPKIEREERMKRERALEEARAMPDGVEREIWVGRRLGYLHRYDEAIAHFTAAIEKHPHDARLWRHRGHRYITVRKFPEALADLQQALKLVKDRPDEIEPDGMPNAANIPTSTLNGNIAYHLALAFHLNGDFSYADIFFRQALEIATTDDSRVAAAYWVIVTRVRLGKPYADLLAKLPREVTLLENQAYWALIKLFRDEIMVDSLRAEGHDVATLGYGIAMFHYAHGDKPAALAELRTTVRNESWPSFGFIAAEAALRSGLR
jgi:tetratricopeptide (TPR) repeat protein